MKKKPILLCCLFLFPAAITNAQLSAYVPQAEVFVVTPTFVYQTYNEYWTGQDKVHTREDEDVVQRSGFITFEYGILENFAADVTVGYTAIDDTTAFSVAEMSDDGLTDTTFGLRWQFLDEKRISSPFLPTLTLRVGGIIEGTYDQSFPFSAGDGASGFETSLLFGKEICPHLGFYGDFGYRNRNHNVPDDLFGSAGIYLRCKGFTVSGGYRHVQGLSGLNIGGAGFTPSRFPELREISQTVEASIGYTDGGGRYYAIFGATTLDGKNTGDKDVAGITASFPF